MGIGGGFVLVPGRPAFWIAAEVVVAVVGGPGCCGGLSVVGLLILGEGVG